jgi:2-C-methyl-D-erythritol 4-phosphate cytidylyltransferase
MKVTAIIPAGGKGLRSGLKIPKQFAKIKGRELITYTIEVFQRNKSINKIIIAAPEEYFPLLEKCRSKYKFSKITGIVKGGTERQDSVYNALKSDSFADDDLILVHDAARPLLSSKLLSEIIALAVEKGNAVPAVKARDTLAYGNKIITSYLNRENVYYLQTPQAFRYSGLKFAFEKAYKDNFTGTDESMLVQRSGENINIVSGSYQNIKITTPEDLHLFKKLISDKGRILL